MIAVPFVLVAAFNNYLNQVLQVRWRKSMTDDFVGRWLSPAQHFRMRLVAGPADNPDQRISDDIHQFVGNTMVLGIGFFGNFLRLAIFLQVLWAMSTAFPDDELRAVVQHPWLSRLARPCSTPAPARPSPTSSAGGW